MRSWPMLAAVGAGLVLIAVAAGAGGASAWGIAASIVLTGCGAAALGWGVLALRAGEVPAPRATLVASAGALAASGALVASGAAPSLGIAVLPLAVADVFLLVVAVAAAAEFRAGRRPARDDGRRRSARDGRDELDDRDGSAGRVGRDGSAGGGGLSVVGLLLGAALVSGLATPALAATDAGELAVPHGELHGGGHGH
ncbi:hypothetical protein ABIQ69_02250 [Agromyces sp. G08B096]|uniref:Histidine kinase n=1 Tax=Agromyces sp. G08B096 TaxID=3156399 RepID=A0AAU7WA46_9MICO